MVTHKHDLCAASRGRGVCELHLFAARMGYGGHAPHGDT